MSNLANHRNRRILLRSEEFDFPSSGGAGSERFFCPTCGELWGGIFNSPNMEIPFHVSTVPCERHGTKYQRGGAVSPHLVFYHHDFGFKSREELLKSLPRPLIEREVLLKIEQMLTFGI